MTPRFGSFLFTTRWPGQSDGEVLRRSVDHAVRAEALGFDDLWVSEHHFISYGVNPSALTLASHLLGRTTHVRVGTAVTLLPQHPPVFVAEQAALLDQLSDGRFDLGLGRGGPVVDLLVAGRTVDHWSRGFWEALDLLRAAWAGPVDAGSDLFRFPPVTARPHPRGPSGPPLLVAATSEASIDRAARRGLPLLLFLHETAESRARAVARWAGVAAEHGHPVDRPGHAFAVVGQVLDGAVSADLLVDRLTDFFVRSGEEYVFLPEASTPEVAGRPDPHDPGQLRQYTEGLVGTHPVGDVGQCTERLVEAMTDSGIDRVLLMLEAAGEPAAILRNVTAFGHEVLPAVRARLS